jgi:hypothetical protein
VRHEELAKWQESKMTRRRIPLKITAAVSISRALRGQIHSKEAKRPDLLASDRATAFNLEAAL